MKGWWSLKSGRNSSNVPCGAGSISGWRNSGSAMSRSTAAHPEIKTAGASGAPISHIESICSIDNENVVIPIRSRLYYFEPVGIGTRDVECFTSYISRLGDAHCISVHSLVQHEILTQFDNVYRTEPRLLKSFWKASTAALNGTCSSTSNWVDALT